MELKHYQQAVLNDLSRYLNLIGETGSASRAYEKLWNEKQVRIGFGGLPYYHNTITDVPDVCLKVPTSGGKTFIACNALKRIFDALPYSKCKAVVWLVPSEAILSQTLGALSNPSHPYRQRINSDFQNRVEVYSKEQLLNGQNFNPTTVNEQLSIFVLSYDSFRTSNRDGRRAYRENGNLALFAKVFQNQDILLADTDDTALIQVIRYLNPVVIVDESHHATSQLSVQMLKDFNPSFVLDLTATPKENSNIISFVDARQLKQENMVKLPVIVYNRRSKTDVIADAIHIRDRLEAEAKIAQENGGKYIRPIVLLQAQPRNNNDSATFERIKEDLLEIGIPEEQIAIKTANINELRNVDLLSDTSPIRYIITVNALKEGWDCPFAYVLATVANRTSTVDVEQILGRILRLPYARKNQSNVLNISYVITSSSDFHATLDKVVKGLNSAGFSARDCRVEEAHEETPITPVPQTQQSSLFDEAPEEDEPIDTTAIRERLNARSAAEENTPAPITSDRMLCDAIKQAEGYDIAISQSGTDFDFAPQEVREYMNTFRIKEEYHEQVRSLVLPQFHIEAPPSLFSDSETRVLTKEALSVGFGLRDKDTQIDFSTLSTELGRVDLEENQEALPRAWRIDSTDSRYYLEWMRSQPEEHRIKHCEGVILRQLNKINCISDRELKEYIHRVVSGLNGDQLEEMQQSPYLYGDKIKKKVEALLDVHRATQFTLLCEQGKITCQPSWHFMEVISPTNTISTFPKSLYSAEEDMNGLEKDVAWELANMENIVWWHRNISRSGFNINGYINAFPDIIALTTSGKILMIEPKGDHLENSESRKKVEIGRTWMNLSGSKYRYYMVFRDRPLNIEGAVHFDRFVEIVRGM